MSKIPPLNTSNVKHDKNLLDFKKTLNKEGHLEEKGGGVMTYVAKDFMEKLKTGGESSKSARKLTDIPTINPWLLEELEKDCVQLSTNVDAVMKDLSTSLHKISAISVANTQACNARISAVNSSVDGAVHNMYSLIAQCEELDKTMEPVYQLAHKVSNLKEIVSTLDSYIR